MHFLLFPIKTETFSRYHYLIKRPLQQHLRYQSCNDSIATMIEIRCKYDQVEQIIV